MTSFQSHELFMRILQASRHVLYPTENSWISTCGSRSTQLSSCPATLAGHCACPRVMPRRGPGPLGGAHRVPGEEGASCLPQTREGRLGASQKVVLTDEQDAVQNTRQGETTTQLATSRTRVPLRAHHGITRPHRPRAGGVLATASAHPALLPPRSQTSCLSNTRGGACLG